MDCKYCIDKLDFTVKIAQIKTKCKYHHKKGEVYLPLSLVPKGLCMDLFYAAYPGCLAVLYNGIPVRLWSRKKGMQKTIACCPHPRGITVEIRSKEILPAPLRMLKEFFEEFLKIAYKPLDGHFRRVFIEIIETSQFCPKGYKLGDTFEFNTNKKNELCPAGFSTIYPYLRFVKNIKTEKDVSLAINIHCPDHLGIVYELGVT